MAYPELRLAEWRRTRDTLQGYCRILGGIRRAASPRQRHWGHTTLSVTAEGLTTTPIPAHGVLFELRIDLTRHRLLVVTSRGGTAEQELVGQASTAVLGQLNSNLEDLGIPFSADLSEVVDDRPGAWDRDSIGRYRTALGTIDSVLKGFKGTMRQESSPVQLFPHHFDLALSWYSGRWVPGEDPQDEEMADEQMTFGFSTGDQAIADPYFYATAYPQPPGFVGSELPSGARWQQEGFSGAVLPYTELVGDPDADQRLRRFLELAHHAGASHMR